jgi:membrane protein DedA with SNARE-associated domain/membrane-associated phospholipid phosphatase
MPTSLDHLLPSLEALGLWSYWIIGMASLLEAYFVTGVIIPGTLVVDAGGTLVQLGLLDFFDLVWFVAVGSIIGGQLGFYTGLLVQRGVSSKWKPEQSPSYEKAERLFKQHGGKAIVIGRFLGPASGLIPFAAAVAGMDRRAFLFWNIVSSFPYAIVHLLIGYFLGNVVMRLGPLATRATIAVLAIAMAIAVVWWLVVRIVRLMPFVLSVGRTMLLAAGSNPDVQAWAFRHPKSAGFIRNRFDRSRFSGLTSTLLATALFYIFGVWLGIVFDFLLAEPILTADVRIANLIHAFWTPQLLQTAAYATSLGDWRVVSLLFGASLCWLSLYRRINLAIGLCVAVAGDLVSVSILKGLFHRPRPEFGFFIETSGSFPSGHAAISVAFYGMLFYSAWREGKFRAIGALIAAVTLAFLVGLSRIYLIEHFLTDVLNGWLTGAIWLVIGITVAEWVRSVQTASPTLAFAPWMSLIAGTLSLSLIGGAGWVILTFDKAKKSRSAAEAVLLVSDVSSLLTSGKIPINTESVGGAALEPINLVFQVKSEEALTDAMSKAGWVKAVSPNPTSLVHAAWAAWTNQQDSNAPVTPYFWESRPNDAAFQRPTQAPTLRKRHHVRVWQTRYTTSNGDVIYVGAASLDDGLDWGLLHHIDPNLDAERDTLASDLTKADLVDGVQNIAATPPRLGQYVAGDPWFTDGNALLLRIR